MLEIAGGILLAYFALVLIAVFIRPILWLLACGACVTFLAAMVFFIPLLFH